MRDSNVETWAFILVTFPCSVVPGMYRPRTYGCIPGTWYIFPACAHYTRYLYQYEVDTFRDNVRGIYILYVQLHRWSLRPGIRCQRPSPSWRPFLRWWTWSRGSMTLGVVVFVVSVAPGKPRSPTRRVQQQQCVCPTCIYTRYHNAYDSWYV